MTYRPRNNENKIVHVSMSKSTRTATKDMPQNIYSGLKMNKIW
jgi:hypothetical protein